MSKKNDSLKSPIFWCKTSSTVLVLYHINLNGFFSLYVKEVKIAVDGAELVLCSGPQKVEKFYFT